MMVGKGSCSFRKVIQNSCLEFSLFTSVIVENHSVLGLYLVDTVRSSLCFHRSGLPYLSEKSSPTASMFLPECTCLRTTQCSHTLQNCISWCQPS